MWSDIVKGKISAQRNISKLVDLQKPEKDNSKSCDPAKEINVSRRLDNNLEYPMIPSNHQGNRSKHRDSTTRNKWKYGTNTTAEYFKETHYSAPKTLLRPLQKTNSASKNLHVFSDNQKETVRQYCQIGIANGVVKPNATLDQVTNDINSECNELGASDFVIVCDGTTGVFENKCQSVTSTLERVLPTLH